MKKTPVQSKQEVFDALVNSSEELRRLGVDDIRLFGSFVHGTPSIESDVDLLVSFRPGTKNFDHFMELGFFLEGLLGRPVELVTRESLSPYLGPHILANSENVPLAA